MFGIQHFEAFIIASLMLNLVPGPDTFYILGRGLAQGRQIGMASALGISAGALCHTLMAAAGLSALIIASPTAFITIKVLGAAYLIFLGIKLLVQSSKGLGDQAHYVEGNIIAAFKQGLITNVLNPKVALFFLAFLPQFIAPSSANHFISFLLLGLTFVFTSTLWGFVLACSSAAISRKLRESPKALVRLNQLTGTLLVGLGVRLVLDKS